MDPGGTSGAWQRTSGNISPTLPLSRPDSPISRKSSSGSSGAWSSKSNGSAASSYAGAPKKWMGRHLRKLSTSLPTYSPFSPKTPRTPLQGAALSAVGITKAVLRRFRPGTLLVLLVFIIYLFLSPVLLATWRRTSFLGGGSKFVIILASNPGGGVISWKGPKEWASERESIKNKRAYAKKWGYTLAIKDVKQKKRYAHEWREGWEKVDVIKQVMREHPNAEWFWWLDLHTFIMEPTVSLQSHIFNSLTKNTYRDINLYNPLNITHPFPKEKYPYLSAEELSPIGDGKASSINLIIPQDCGGFNLGSFFIRRSDWTTRLLDMWWDPVGYEQKHMQWEHKEQDALEHYYTEQPWIRSHTAFIAQRMINSFPPGACAETPNDPRIFYNEKDRDFLVNMAGCEWGRDCWTEIWTYRELSKKLNKKKWWEVWKRA